MEGRLDHFPRELFFSALAGHEQDARQPCLAIEADVPSDTKTHKRMEDAIAVQAKHEGSCSASQVDPNPMCLTNYGDDFTRSPTLPCSRNNALVDNGVATPKSCLSPVEMRTLTAASGVLPAGKASTTTRITYHQPGRWFCATKDTNSKRTSIQYASYYSSF